MTPVDPPPDDQPEDLVPLTEAPAVPTARRVEPPPGPGFAMAMVWWAALLAALYIPFIAGLVIALGVQAVASGNPQGYFREIGNETKKAQDQDGQKQAGQRPAMHEGLSYAMAVGFAAGHLGTLALTLILLRYVTGPDWPRQVGLRRPSLGQMVLAVMILPGFMLVHNAAHLLVNELFAVVVDALFNWKYDPNEMFEGMEAMFKPWPVWVAVLVLGVGPGLIEELFCRGFLGRGLVARYGFVGGVILTSALFGALHLHPLYAVGTAVMGGLLHMAYLFTRSLWVPIFLHFANNSASALAATVQDMPGKQALEADPPAGAYFVAVALSALGLWAFWSCRPTIVPDPYSYLGEERPLWRPRYPGVEYPPPGSGAVVRRRWPHPIPFLLTVAAFGGMVYLLVNPN